MLERAHCLLTVKSVDAEKRVISGVATTPEVDRVGDVIDPLGVTFRNPLPLLLYHDSQRPVGIVKFAKPTKHGIEFEASIASIDEPGTLRDRVNEAWQSIRAKLIRGVSIGFRALDDGIERMTTGGLRFTKTEVLELSLVCVPANASATIHTVKDIRTLDSAASGVGPGAVARPSAGGSAVVAGASQGAKKMKTTTHEQIASFEASRHANDARMGEIMQKSAELGETLDAAQKEEYDALDVKVKEIDEHLVRLRAQEQRNKAAAVPVAGDTTAAASASRGGMTVTVKDNVPPGIGFSRLVICKAASFLSQGSLSPLDIAKQRYPHDPRIQQALIKAAVPAGTTTNDAYAGSLVQPETLASEFLEFLRPDTLVGKFGANGVPSLRRLPFNTRINGQISGGSANWVGQGKPKPVTSVGFNAQTMLFTKIAAIAVITEETARFSSPSAEALVRDALKDAVVERMDIDFIDPTVAAVSGVNPASITNGLTPLSSAGVTADFSRTDVGTLLRAYLNNNMRIGGIVLIMPTTLALALTLSRNTLGQREFPEMTVAGGTLEGIPVITTEYAANQSGAGNMVIAVNTRFVGLADDGQVNVDISREASVEMSDAPTQNGAAGTGASLVSLWQNNLIGLRAERFVNWSVLRAGAVHYMDDVNWGSVGSPS